MANSTLEETPIEKWLRDNPDPFPAYKIVGSYSSALDYDEYQNYVISDLENNKKLKEKYTVADFDELERKKIEWDKERLFFLRHHPISIKSNEKPFFMRVLEYFSGTKRKSNKCGTNKHKFNKRGTKRRSNKRG